MTFTKFAAAAAVAVLLGPQAAAQTFAVTNVRVFDGVAVIPKATVVVVDGRIAAVGSKAKVPAGVMTVDGGGKTLLPGLIDSHTHTFGAARSDALRFGVTTELDMFAHPAMLGPVRKQRESLEKTAQADLFSAGVLATAPGGHGTQFGFPIPTLTTPAEADAFVAARIAEGSDYIKLVYAPRRTGHSLDGETLAAVIAAAHARGKLAVVHVQELEAARTAVDAGADGLAHVFADTPGDAAFHRRVAGKKVFVVPTLSVFAGISGEGEGAKLAADPKISPYLTVEQARSLKQGFRPQTFYTFAAATGAVAGLKAAGVDILAGTDAGNPSVAHGASLHQELALLVGAGLTPLNALRAATSTPARRFKLADRGRIAAGAKADLLLVEGDPTVDITATRAIAMVWKNGYPVERKTVEVQAPTPVPLTGLLGGFETGLNGPDGATWQATSDRLAGGQSDARISHVAGALRVEGQVRPPFPVAWGGATVLLSAAGAAPRDISGAKALVLRVRGQGSGPQGRVMLFDVSSPQPKSRPFTFAADWQEVRVPIAEFQGLDTRALVGVAITTDGAHGPFAFEIDDVRLE